MLSNTFITKMTIREICHFANIEVPAYMAYIQDVPLTNMAFSKLFMKKGGALFLTSTYSGEPLQDVLKLAREVGVIAIFVTYKQYNECELRPDLIPCKLPGDIARGISNKIRKDLNLKVVGVTGSIGKTTVKDFIYAVVKEHFDAAKCIGNQNTQFPIFNNMQRLSKSTEVFVQEFGINLPGTMPRSVDACVPDIGVITNIKNPHIDKYGTLENILREKEKMVKKMPAGSPVILNYNDELLQKWDWEKYKTIWISDNNEAADYYAKNIKQENGQLEFDVISRNNEFNIRLPIPGIHNVTNALFAIAVGDVLGIPKEKIERGLNRYTSSGIRQNFMNLGGYNLFIDCYNNSAEEALISSVNVLDAAPVQKGAKKIAIISNINVGNINKNILNELNREAGKKLPHKKIDLFYCIGDESAKSLADGIRENNGHALYTDSRKILNTWIQNNITKEDLILFKGTSSVMLQRTIDQIFGTYFQTAASKKYILIDNYKCRIIDETTIDKEKYISICEYKGDSKNIELQANFDDKPVFSIGERCYADNDKIESIRINDGITNIANQAFINCINLHEIELPKTLKGIGDFAFKNCKNLKKISIPEGTIFIGKQAFAGCEKLETICIPSSIGEIGEKAFENCLNLELKIESNKYVEQYAKQNMLQKYKF